MDLGEKIFSKLWRISHPNLSNNHKNIAEVSLKSIQERLTILARALTNTPIFIYPSQEEGGWYKNKFYLPATFNRYENHEINLDYYFFRVIFLSNAYLGSLVGKRPQLSPEESREFCYDLSEYILPKMRKDFPPFVSKVEAVLEAEKKICPEPKQMFWLWGRWLSPPTSAKHSSQPQVSGEEEEKETELITTEIEGVVRDEIEVLELNKKAQEDYTLGHNFEKCLTAEDFNGNWRDFDGDDDLADQEAALDEVSMSHVIRVHDPVHAVLRSKLRLNALLPEESSSEESKGIPVKEWDYRKKIYLDNHCKVYCTGLSTPTPGSVSKTLLELNGLRQEILKKYRSILNEREVVRRVSFGEELDLDAMVDCYSEVKAGNHMPENIYRSKRKKRLNVAVSFLVDLSLSTDSFVDNERILDLEKRTLLVFGQILNDLDLNFSIHGFYSETRNHCTLQTIKNFNHTWNESKDGVGSIRSAGYTRMGPALRVLTDLLDRNSNAKDKLLIFITDGKPTDYDLYEGTYGIYDVRMAIKEARRKGIRCCGLAMDPEAKLYFPVMMGDEPFEVLRSPKELTPCLTTFFAKIFSRF